MSHQAYPATRPAIEEVEQQFAHWRQTRAQKSPIPDELWASAVELARQHSISEVAKTLRLDYNSLKKRVLAKQNENNAQAEPYFVEVALNSSLPQTELHIETQDRTGALLKMHIKGPDLPNPLEILTRFWSNGS